MNALVSADDRPRARVSPKVFADVPSRAELAAVRRNRNSLAVWVVLLLGMLIASVGALVFVVLTPSIITGGDTATLRQQWADRGSALDRTRAELNATLTELERTRAIVDPNATPIATVALATDSEDVPEVSNIVADLTRRISAMSSTTSTTENEFSAFRRLRDQESRVTQLKSTIGTLLNHDSRRNASTVGSLQSHFEVYNNEAPLLWRAAQEQALQTYIESLQSACGAIRQYNGLTDTLGRPVPRSDEGPPC